MQNIKYTHNKEWGCNAAVLPAADPFVPKDDGEVQGRSPNCHFQKALYSPREPLTLTPGILSGHISPEKTLPTEPILSIQLTIKLNSNNSAFLTLLCIGTAIKNEGNVGFYDPISFPICRIFPLTSYSIYLIIYLKDSCG